MSKTSKSTKRKRRLARLNTALNWRPENSHKNQLAFTFPDLKPEPVQLLLMFTKEPVVHPPIKCRGLVFHGFTSGYERAGIYNLEKIFTNLGQRQVDFDGDLIDVISHRYHLFAQNAACVVCGIEGLYFAKERSAKQIKVSLPGGRQEIQHKSLNGERQQWHLNLYALRELEDGSYKEILMTKDHILPVAKGGKDEMTNYQTMCQPCNGYKADKLIQPIRKKDLLVQSISSDLEVMSLPLLKALAVFQS